MPASAPKTSKKTNAQLRNIGELIRLHRKSLGITATATSEAAGVSRVTLHRIEKGVASVTIGAYFNVLAVLNLTCALTELRETSLNETHNFKPDSNKTGWIPAKIVLANYPQLKQIAWHIQGVDELSPIEALEIYERNARFIEDNKLSDDERNLIESLQIAFEGRKK